jgi:hypothetical protein
MGVSRFLAATAHSVETHCHLQDLKQTNSLLQQTAQYPAVVCLGGGLLLTLRLPFHIGVGGDVLIGLSTRLRSRLGLGWVPAATAGCASACRHAPSG